MKLLAVSSYFDTHPGGLETVAGQLARALARRVDQVEWAASRVGPAPTEQNLIVTGLKASNAIENKSGLPVPLISAAGLMQLNRSVKNNDVVLIHDSLYTTSIAAFLLSKLHSKPILLMQHLARATFNRKIVELSVRFAEQIVTKPMLRAADQVVFVSESAAAHFASCRLRRTAWVSLGGVDTTTFHPATGPIEKLALRDRLGLAKDRRIGLYVGRFVETKGLEALRRLAILRADLDFALAGWGAIDPETWGIRNVKVFRGLKGEALAELYRCSDVFLLASPSESFSLVVREALATGLPVICGESVAASDGELRDHVTVVQLSADDWEGSAQAMASALDMPISGEAADARVALVQRRYDWDQIAAKLASLLTFVGGPLGTSTAARL